MVINGGARSTSTAYAAWLGGHLKRSDSNERVFVRRLDGVASDELGEALLEMSAVASGATRSTRGLYHANIDWKHTEHLTDAQKDHAVDRLALELGLAGQPCAVVEHVKDGREHLHIVWMRIDMETGTAISDSHNFRRHEIVARELEREFGLERVQGAHIERDGIERPARTPEAFEFAQAARSGITPAEARAELSGFWQSADTGLAFAAALAEAGWVLAQGDKRDVLVALDPMGETHAINKKITGLAAKEVRARLADLDASMLPSVDQARQMVRDRQAEPELQPEPVFPAPEPVFSAELPPDLDARFGPSPQIDTTPEAEPARSYVPNFVLVDGLDAENTPQHRQARPHQVQEPQPEGPRRRDPDHEASPAAHDNDARRAMEALARTDPLGMAARQGFHVGDCLKSPEEMRREWADRARSFEPVAEQEQTPEPMPWGRLLRTLAEADAKRAQGAAPETKAEIAAPSPEATRQTFCEVAPEPKALERHRLAEIVAAARARLAALGERLDIAFGRFRDQVLGPKPEAPDAMSRAPESGPVNARMAADFRPAPKPAPSVDEDRAREIQRQIETGRKAEPYDRDRMRDLSRQHHELRGAAPDVAPAPVSKASPPTPEVEGPEDRKARIKRLTDELVKSWESRQPPPDFSR